MTRTHDLAEWASVLSGSVGVYGVFSAVWFLLVDAHRSDFDPRPAVRRVVESGHVDVLLVAAGPRLCNLRTAARAAAHPSVEFLRDAAALLILLTTSPKGALA